ncbi:MAG TPA: hypothetical protein VIS77_06330 [Burkholderiales bacterium]
MSDTDRKKQRRKAGKTGGDLSVIPAAQLQAELARRQRRVHTLKRRYQRLMDSANALRAEIAALGGTAGAPGAAAKNVGVHPRNDFYLLEALKRAIGSKTMSVTEAADAVLKAGYSTTSPSFRQIVNSTLIRSGAFTRVERGRYRLK